MARGPAEAVQSRQRRMAVNQISARSQELGYCSQHLWFKPIEQPGHVLSQRIDDLVNRRDLERQLQDLLSSVDGMGLASHVPCFLKPRRDACDCAGCQP